jgi:trimeric autotransporter adhesin
MKSILALLAFILVLTHHAGAQSWSTTGNAGLSSATHFIGTTDNVPLIFKVNGTRSGLIETTLYNTAFGYGSFINNSSGTNNTALGNATLLSNTTGANNTAVGKASLVLNTTGYRNTAVGSEALVMNTTGNYNNALGYNALLNNTTGLANIAIGDAALFNSSHLWIGGWVPWSVYSDARIKTNITESVKGLDFIMKLRPVTYNRTVIAGKSMPEYANKYDAEKTLITGFVAQEVEQAAKESGYDFSGLYKPKSDKDLYSISYESFVVPLVKAMQEQQAIIETLNNKIKELEKRLARLEVL